MHSQQTPSVMSILENIGRFYRNPWYLSWWLYHKYWTSSRADSDSRFAPSQWETTLLSNDVTHWLGANLEPALRLHARRDSRVFGLGGNVYYGNGLDIIDKLPHLYDYVHTLIKTSIFTFVSRCMQCLPQPRKIVNLHVRLLHHVLLL